MKSVQLTEGEIFMISDLDLVDASFWIRPSWKWSLLHPRSLSYPPPPPFPAPWLQELEFGVVGRDKRVKTWFACACDFAAAAAACPPIDARNPEKKRRRRFGRKGLHNNAGSYGDSRPWKHKESIPPFCSFSDQIFWSINKEQIIIRIRMWGR